MNVWSIILDALVVMFFVMLNGFFVAAEFAIVKVRSTQIEPLAQKGNRRAKIAQEIISHLDASLSATQLGITMSSLALGWIGEPLVASLFDPLFTGFGISDPRLIHGVSFAVAFSIITLIHIVLGELGPKWIAIQNAGRTTLWTAYPLKLFLTVFKPFIWVLNSLANALIALLGIQPLRNTELVQSEEELRLSLAQNKRVSGASKNIVLNAMDFRRKQARHAMVPRREIVALLASAPFKTSLEIIRTHKFSRFPVYKETIDNVIGILHTKEVFKFDKHLDPHFEISSIVRDPVVLPETALLEIVLETMLRRKTHMVILADEYGGTAGLITLENVLEELVGPIQDEFDRETPDVLKVGENEYVVSGGMTTNDIERLISRELSSGEILSIGGFVIERLGHIPRKGERLKTNGAEFTVEKVENNAVESLRVKRTPVEQDGDESNTGG